MGLLAVLLFNFRSILGPLLLAFILTYLLHPVAALLSRATRLSWRVSANLVFLLVVILIVGLSTLTGVVIVQQVQSLIRVLQGFINDLPDLIDSLDNQIYMIGPYQIALDQFFDLSSLSDQIISWLQILVGRAGSLVSTFATGAASMVGWALFSLVVAYFILADAGQVPDAIQFIRIPGYDYDVRRMAHELGKIWNAFLRGQLIIVGLVILSYTILMNILGVRYALGLAIMAGLARFVPYVGPWTTTMVTFLVAFFQTENYFGLPALYFALLVISLSFLLDQVFDNLVSPRLLGQTLGVHPAAVLVAAIIAARLIGIIGLVLAAPVLASFKLVSQYTIRKLFDLEPWPEEKDQSQTLDLSWLQRGSRRTLIRVRRFFDRLKSDNRK